MGAAAVQAYAHGGLPRPNEDGDVSVPRYMMHKTYDLTHKTYAQLELNLSMQLQRAGALSQTLHLHSCGTVPHGAAVPCVYPGRYPGPNEYVRTTATKCRTPAGLRDPLCRAQGPARCPRGWGSQSHPVAAIRLGDPSPRHCPRASSSILGPRPCVTPLVAGVR